MRNIAPRLGDNFPEENLARDQEEYFEMVVCPIAFNDGHGGMLSRWKFTDEEKQAIANGEDLYVIIFTGPTVEIDNEVRVRSPQPISLCIGRPESIK